MKTKQEIMKKIMVLLYVTLHFFPYHDFNLPSLILMEIPHKIWKIFRIFINLQSEVRTTNAR